MKVLKNNLAKNDIFVISGYGPFILLEYADVIWDNNITYLFDKIEKVQMEAARIVTGGTRLVSINNLCLETGWDKLKNRREMLEEFLVL
jgi:hypothetical protein